MAPGPHFGHTGFTPNPCRVWASAHVQRSMGERRCTPYTGRQFITGQHGDAQENHTHTRNDGLERPFNRTVIFWDCGRKLELTHSQRDCANFQQTPNQDSNHVFCLN